MGGQAKVVRALALSATAALAAFACGGNSAKSNHDGGGNGAAATTSGAGGSAQAGGSAAAGEQSGGTEPGPSEAGAPPSAGTGGSCVGLECEVPACDDGTTSISGRVFDPSLTLPLYNVTVFVPNAPVPELASGAVCEHCGAPGVPVVATTTTDQSGDFTLEGVPAGQAIPLVVQIGKWRRQVSIDNVATCQELALDPELTRLPRNKREGDLPRIAISAGAADQMECLPRRLGIDDAEFTTNTGDGSVHLFTGNHNNSDVPITKFAPQLNDGAALPSSDTLWQSADALAKYDLVLLSCEGNSFEYLKPMPLRQAMYDYVSSGGRVLASHWHHVWFSAGPSPLPTTGAWSDRRDPTEDGAPLAASINQSFPKGAAFAEWLVSVGASSTPGQLMVEFPRDNLQAANPMIAREWITAQNSRVVAGQDPKTVQFMSFAAPIGAPLTLTCGRAAFTGLHVSDQSAVGGAQLDFPLGCENRGLSAQEKAIAFMLFELGSCIDDSDIP